MDTSRTILNIVFTSFNDETKVQVVKCRNSPKMYDIYEKNSISSVKKNLEKDVRKMCCYILLDDMTF